MNTNSGVIDNASGGQTTVSLSSTNVTLTVDQAAYNLIILSGVLTANVQLIFPGTIGGKRFIQNGCTGNFTVTALNGAADTGGGVVIPQQSQPVPVILTQAIAYADQGAFGNLAISLTSSDVTLTAGQAAFNFFTLSGTLTGNVSVIFPTASYGRKTFQNNCTGAHTVTAKNGAGDTGVVIPQQSQPCPIQLTGGTAYYDLPYPKTVTSTNTVSLLNNTVTNITSITIPAGNWLLYGRVTVTPSGGNLSTVIGNITTSSGSLAGTQLFEVSSTGFTFGIISGAIPTQLLSLSTPTLYYLVGYITTNGSSDSFIATITAVQI
jgi:hypothetical protein